MRLALLVDDYLPHSTRVAAKMMHELALEFKQMGHDPVVITPAAMKPRLEVDSLDGIDVWRFRNGPVKDVGKVKRAINESLLSFNAWLAIKTHVTKKPFDGVVCYSPSIFWGPLVNKLKMVSGCKSYLVLRDMFPQWVVDNGLLKESSIVCRYFRLVESFSYKNADSIGLMSCRNLDAFFDEHGDKYDQHVLFNWASVIPEGKPKADVSIRTRLGLEDKLIFFYGGNIGSAQDMKNLVRLAKSLEEYEQAHFLFLGQGDEVSLVKQLASEWQMKNLTLLPSVSQVEFKKILADVDVGLFSLARSHSSHNFPGKILGYMVQSLPILGSVNPGNDLMTIINDANAGRVHINGDDEALLDSARKMILDAEQRLSQGNNAFNLLEEKFSVASAGRTIINKLV